MEPQTVLLTGANGHIGANIARELLRRGHRVVGYVRETSDLRGLAGLDIELRRGDILDADRLIRAAEGCDAVIHTAAVYSLWAGSDEDIINPCVQGTENIFRAAQTHGIRRVVYTSSAAAIGWSNEHTEVRDETDWNDDPSTAYYVAKTDSERLAHRLAQEIGLELIILNPSVVAGPYDFKPTPSTAMLLNALNGTSPWWDAVFAFVHVEDVARLHVDGLTLGTPGERYLATGPSVPLREIAGRIRELFGIRVPVLNLPRPVAVGAGALLGLVSKLTGKPPLFDRRVYEDVMSVNGVFDNGKSRQAFGIEYRPIETILADSTSWLAHAGMLKPKAAERVRAVYPPKPEWPAGVPA
ncbi:MAG TPA: NAD-dependent epimerase/dehydratase family protein [Anaerolineales bacterium]|nr:NAD-dependent epimerase/dehydratase family protein [Anaerolineales bacterium]